MQGYFMWDSFTSGVATSIMRNLHKGHGENEFAEMEHMDITVVTSNKPYGISDGSNPFFDGLKTPKFNLTEGGVHSGHVQTGLRDPFCFVHNGKGRCKVMAFSYDYLNNDLLSGKCTRLLITCISIAIYEVFLNNLMKLTKELL